jgi:hypothetical protein
MQNLSELYITIIRRQPGAGTRWYYDVASLQPVKAFSCHFEFDEAKLNPLSQLYKWIYKIYKMIYKVDENAL